MYNDSSKKEESCLELCCHSRKGFYHVFPINKNIDGNDYRSVKSIARGIVNDLFPSDFKGDFYSYDRVKVYFSSLNLKEIKEKGTEGIPCLNVTRKGWKLENSFLGTGLSKKIEFYLFGMLIKERMKKKFGNENV